MAQLIKDPISGAYIVKEGDTLSKIATTQGRTLQELIASNPQFTDPNKIRPGDMVVPQGGIPGGLYGENPEKTINYASPQTTPPSYSNLTSNAGFSLPQGGGNSTTSFTEALIKMLKEAQGRDQAGQAKLMMQGQNIIGQGITDANRNFKNERLAPSPGTSLGLSAQNQFDPLTLSIANQQKLATQNLGNITDLVNTTQDAYDKEQDRIQRAEEKRLDAIEKAKDRSSNTGGYTPQELRKLRAAGIDSTDLELSDRFLYAGGGANINDDVISPYYDRIATSMLDMIGGDKTFKNLDELKEYLDKTPTVTINSKKVTLNPTQVAALKDEIQSQRTLFQRLIPGGK